MPRTPNQAKLDEAYNEAFANPGKSIPIGDVVVCDLYNTDYTESKTAGGLIFQSKGVCPQCQPGLEASIKKYGEEEFVRARNTDAFKSFADFVREYRGPNSTITVTKL